jgi:DNA-binding beta-propeller fold protein YncE
MIRNVLGAGVVAVAVTAAVHWEISTAAQSAVEYPVFEVDTAWPPKLPNNWVLGQTPGVAVDRNDHIWVLHRPRTVPEAQRANAAPPLIEFDADGKFLRAWGGPGTGFDWPDSEHGVYVDHKDNIWVGGSSPTSTSLTKRSDDILLKFSKEGKFLLQIGGPDKSKGNADTSSVNKPADAFVYRKTNELFVADGYGNRRILVLNPDTGAFKRMWGGFGDKPIDAAAGGRGSFDVEGEGPRQFGGPVHAVKVSNDDRVYVADRQNRRIQVFSLDGKYITQTFVNRSGPANGSVAGLAFSPDAAQRFLYLADYGNSHIIVMDRQSLNILYQFGIRSTEPGDFQGPHHLAATSKGDLVVAEVSPGNRIQRFRFKGMSKSLPPSALTPEQLAASPIDPRQAAPTQTPPTSMVPPKFPAPGQARGGYPPWPSTMAAPYQITPNWPRLGDIKPGAAIGIIPDGKGGTWLHHRSEPPILYIDPSGNVTRRFGNGMFVQAHGFCQDRDGNFWAGDSGPFADSPATRGRGFQLFKFSPEGKVLLSLGKAGVSKADKATTFIGPTACAIAPNGDIIVADGHWPRPTDAQQDGDRLVRIRASDGSFIAEYGKMGQAPGEFMGPHALAFDSQGRLFVADRSNNRVQIFDRNMQFVDEWRHFGRPSGIAILRDDTIIVADSESSQFIGGPPQAPEGGGNVVRNPGWGNGIRIGSAKDGSLRYFVPGTRPEGMGADNAGNVFAGLTGNCDSSPSGGCLQKWVKK